MEQVLNNYHFKNRVTHENVSYAEKISFFADCFEFTILNMGRIGSHPLENHKSLLEKIKFQLENYTTFSRKYIVHYFSHPYLQSKDELIVKHYSSIHKTLLKAKMSCEKDGNYSDADKRLQLAATIAELIVQMEDSLFSNSLDRIIQAILCKYPLEGGKHDHVKIFEYYTPILVTEFAFAGFNIKDLRDIIRMISEKEIVLENNVVETKAILPSELMNLRTDPEKFFKAACDYLNNRNLKQQLEGIYHLLKNQNRSRTLLFQIGSVRSFKPFNFDYSGVSFFNVLPDRYKLAKQRYKSFFPEAQAFAEVTVEAGDEQTTLLRAERKINEALNYFNSIFKINARLDVFDYILEDHGKQKMAIRYGGVIDDSESEKFENGKMEKYLEGANTYLAHKAIKLDTIYFQALGTARSEEKLINFWRYLESYFDYDGYNAEHVIEKVSRMVGRDSITSYIFFAHNLAWYVLTGNAVSYDHKYFNVSREEFAEHLRSKPIGDINFKRLQEIIVHPYVTRQLKWHLESTDEEKIETGTTFYSDLLFETYEQRNLIEHSGVFQEKAVQKLIPSLELLVFKFRNIISREIKAGSFSNFKHLIHHLSVE